MIGEIGFDKWLDLNGADFMSDKITCSRCRGHGWQTCDHCGSEAPCEDCAGSGKIWTSKPVVDGQAAFKAYLAQLERERKMLETWNQNATPPTEEAPAQ